MLTKGLVRQTENPDYPSLDTSRIDAVEAYLFTRNLLGRSEHVLHLETARTLPRNRIVRVVTGERSVILKLFTEWPANGTKAPEPEDRFRAECQFRRSWASADCPRQPMPALLHYDCRGRCLVFEDLGRGGETNFDPSVSDARNLGWFLVNLHHHSQSVPACARYDNWNVRQWLAAHLFAPLSAPSGATTWLQRLARTSVTVREHLTEARLALAQDGPCLIHGDFLPHNWLRIDGSCHVVDAEFSFFGRPEFDAGALVAGLLFRGAPTEVMQASLHVLRSGPLRYETRLLLTYAGVHLSDLMEQASVNGGAGRSANARAMIRRVGRAIEHGAFEPLIN